MGPGTLILHVIYWLLPLGVASLRLVASRMVRRPPDPFLRCWGELLGLLEP